MCCLQLSEKLFVCVFVFSVCASVFATIVFGTIVFVTLVFVTIVFATIVFATLVYLQQLYLVMTRVLCRLSPLIVALPPDSTDAAACCLVPGQEGR